MTKNYQPVTGEAEDDADDDRAREGASTERPTEASEGELELESVRVEVTTSDPKTTTGAGEADARVERRGVETRSDDAG